MVRPIPVLCRVWWTISHACLGLLRLPTPLQNGWGLGLRPRSRGFPAYKRARADVGLPNNTYHHFNLLRQPLITSKTAPKELFITLEIEPSHLPSFQKPAMMN